MNAITNLIPEKYHVLILCTLALLPYLTRGLHAWINKGDLRSIIGAIFFGTNTPVPITQGEDPKQTKLPLALILCAFIPALLICVGCKSTPSQIAYQSAGTTIVSVDVAMSEWGAYVAAKHPPVAQEQAVKAAFEKYQTAMAAVCDAGAIYSASTQTNAPAAAEALQTATANLSTEIGDLENLITSFGVTLK